MGFFDKLFGGKGTKSLPSRDDPAQSASPPVNPSARVRKPSTKCLSEEERRDAAERHSATMRAKFSASAERDRERSVALGVTHFRWVMKTYATTVAGTRASGLPTKPFPMGLSLASLTAPPVGAGA